jgi:hypothetical protein
MYRISPPDESARCSAFDEEMTKGAFKGDISLAGSSPGTPCLFSQAVKEAVALGLTEKDPTEGTYDSQCSMGFAKTCSVLTTMFPLRSFEQLHIPSFDGFGKGAWT